MPVQDQAESDPTAPADSVPELRAKLARIKRQALAFMAKSCRGKIRPTPGCRRHMRL